MRQLSSLFAAAFLSLFALYSTDIQAQVAFTSTRPASPSYTSTEPDATSTKATTATMVLYGIVESPTGPLPGAVVKVNNSKYITVTGSDGSFSLTVPANSGPLQATASYAGYEDVPVTLGNTANKVTLGKPHVIKMSRKYQLKTYLKTARRQSRRALRKI